MDKILIFYKTTPKIQKEAAIIARAINAELQPDKEGKGSTETTKYDLVIPIGGDGTILHSEDKYPGILKLPLGCGRVEFLSSAPLKIWEKAIADWKKGNFFIEKRTKIICNKKYEALNEINLAKTHPGQMFEGEVFINDKSIMTIRGDGLLIATPTGSTAYAMSSGGSIIDPDTKVITIVPVAPFMGISKPVILSDISKIMIKTLTSSVLIIDGIKEKESQPQSEFVIEKSPQITKFIRFHNQPSFYQKIPNLKL